MSEFSISQINKLGQKIRRSMRNGNAPDEKEVNKLQGYRISHQQALNFTFDSLVAKSKFHYKGCVVVYRLKRLDTIIRKIERYPTMSLSRMQDIGGCRAIVFSENQIQKIVSDFDNDPDFNIINRDDYISQPRETGYSSFHLVVQPIHTNQCIEIQLRTKPQHYWATLVEITDLLYGVKLKEGQEHPDLFLFHKLLSPTSGKLSLEEANKLIEIDRKLELFTRLIGLFKGNYFLSLKNWIAGNPQENDAYVIMILNEFLEPEFRFYEIFEEAENEYFSLFTEEEPNMVLVHITKPEFEKIGLAYSNYVLTSHPSIRYYLELFQNLILELARAGKQSEIKEYLNYYSEIFKLIMASFRNELDALKSLSENSTKISIISSDVLTEWRKSLEKRLDFIANEDEKFMGKLDKLVIGRSTKKGLWGKFLNWINDD